MTKTLVQSVRDEPRLKNFVDVYDDAELEELFEYESVTTHDQAVRLLSHIRKGVFVGGSDEHI